MYGTIIDKNGSYISIPYTWFRNNGSNDTFIIAFWINNGNLGIVNIAGSGTMRDVNIVVEYTKN